jgi:transcriptional regulator
MFLPEVFRVDDQTLLHDTIRRYSFGTLVTLADGAPFATHLPFLLDAERNVLRGHVARANPQWRALDGTEEVLAMFLGPHAYVSASWYEGNEHVPTWNYVAVHAYGMPRLLDQAATRVLVGDLVTAHESALSPPWKLERAPAELVAELLDYIVGFEIAISRLEGKLKLSQNREPGDQERVQKRLAESQDAGARAVAGWMAWLKTIS